MRPATSTLQAPERPISLSECWRKAPAHLFLGEEEVHLWLARLEEAPSRLTLANLSAQESARAARFVQPKDRKCYAMAHGILRTLLGRYLDLDGTEVDFVCNAYGRPALTGACAKSGIRFNISHSSSLALLAFTRHREIGVDLERIRPELVHEPIAEWFFAPGESVRLRSLPAPQQAAAFFECWTRKEAYIKARGDGLSHSLDSFEVAFGPEANPAILRSADDLKASSRWSVVNVIPAEGYAGALVVEGPVCKLERWLWAS